MACGENINKDNNCGERRLENVLNYDGLKYILSKLTDKLIIALGVLRVKATKPLHLERTTEESTITVSGYVDTATTDALGVVKVKEGNGLYLNDGTASGQEDNNGQIYMETATQKEAGSMSAEDKQRLDEVWESFYKDEFIAEIETSATSPLVLTSTKTGTKVIIKGNVDTLSTKVDELQEEVDEIKKNEQSYNLFIPVKTLPTEDINENAIYLVPADSEGESNKFIEYYYVDGAWEIMGEVQIETDLSKYLRVELSTQGINFGVTSLEEVLEVKVYSGANVVPLFISNVSTPSNVSFLDVYTSEDSWVCYISRETIRKVSGYISFTITAADVKIPISLPVTSADNNLVLAQGKIYPKADAEKPNEMSMVYNTFDNSTLKFRWLYKGEYYIELPKSWGELFGNFDTTKCVPILTVEGDGQYWGNQVYSGPVYPGTKHHYGTVSEDCWGAIYIIPRYFGEQLASGRPNLINTETPLNFIISYYPVMQEVSVYEYESDIPSTEVTLISTEYSTPEVSVSYDMPFSAEGGTFYPTVAYYRQTVTQTWSNGEISEDEITGDINNKNNATFKFELVDTSTGGGEVIPTRAKVSTAASDISIDESTGAITIPATTASEAVAWQQAIRLTVTSNDVSGYAQTGVIAQQGTSEEIAYPVNYTIKINEFKYIQEGQSKDNYISASGGTVSPTLDAVIVTNYSDGTSTEASLTSAVVKEYSTTSDKFTLDTSTGEITVPASTSSSEVNLGTIHIEVSELVVSGDVPHYGASADVTITQAAGQEVTITYDTPVINLEYDDFPPTGGELTPTFSYSQSWTGSDGSSGVITGNTSHGNGTCYFTVVGISHSTVSIVASTGVITKSTSNSSYDDAAVCEVTVNVTCNSKSASQTVTVYQLPQSQDYTIYNTATLNGNNVDVAQLLVSCSNTRGRTLNTMTVPTLAYGNSYIVTGVQGVASVVLYDGASSAEINGINHNVTSAHIDGTNIYIDEFE